MSYDYLEPENQPTDELIYGKCRMCAQLEELGPDDLCYICEGIVRDNEPGLPAAHISRRG